MRREHPRWSKDLGRPRPFIAGRLGSLGGVWTRQIPAQEAEDSFRGKFERPLECPGEHARGDLVRRFQRAQDIVIGREENRHVRERSPTAMFST